jgi:sporulation protein YlmC with PRC-barrel domain
MNDTNQSLDQSLEIFTQAIKDISEKKDLKFVQFHAKKGESNYGKGLMWSGQGHTRQFIFSKNDKFWSSENIDINADRSYQIGGEAVLSNTQLGDTITKSSLKELGRLTGLIVDGSVSIAQNFYYDHKTKKLGLGTDSPSAKLTIVDDRAEIAVGSESGEAYIGTLSNDGFNIKTNKISRIKVSSSGDITLGNKDLSPVNLQIHGKISVKVNNPDPSVDLHVSGPVRLNNRLQRYDFSYPKSGNHQQGDIVWNENPTPGKPIGWVCVGTGNPGSWAPFGTINHLG